MVAERRDFPPPGAASLGCTRRWGEFQQALDAREEMARKLLGVFDRFDIVASATSPRIAPTRAAYTEWLASETYAPEYTCLTGHMNLLGFPAISIPIGLVDGLPVGLQLVARPDEDVKLLRAARALLEARPWKGRPTALLRRAVATAR